MAAVEWRRKRRWRKWKWRWKRRWRRRWNTTAQGQFRPRRHRPPGRSRSGFLRTPPKIVRVSTKMVDRTPEIIIQLDQGIASRPALEKAWYSVETRGNQYSSGNERRPARCGFAGGLSGENAHDHAGDAQETETARQRRAHGRCASDRQSPRSAARGRQREPRRESCSRG